MADQAATWDPDAIIQPDFAIPEQIFATARRDQTGELALLWAVFIDGIRTYCSEILHRASDGIPYREAERWIFRADSNLPTSFGTLCEVFEIDARRLRRTLLQFRQRPAALPQISRLLEREAA